MIGTTAIWLAVWFVVSVAFGMLLGKLIYKGDAESIPVRSVRRDTQSVEPSERERRRAA